MSETNTLKLDNDLFIKGHRGVGGAGVSIVTLDAATTVNTELTASEDCIVLAYANVTPNAGGVLYLSINDFTFYLIGGTTTGINLLASASFPILKGTKVKLTYSNNPTIHSCRLLLVKYNN